MENPLQESKGANSTSEHPLLSGKILIADDAPDIQKLFAHMLKKTDVELTMVSNGREAVAAAKENHYDLIILDIQMPITDGYMAAQQLREYGLEVPIIAITGNAFEHDAQRCLAAGCSVCLSKAFSKQELFNVIHKQLELSRAIQDKSFLQSTLPVISERFNEDPEYLKILLPFIENIPEKLGAMGEALRSQNMTTLKSMAHQLHGNSAMYGYDAFARCNRAIEIAARDEDIQRCRDLLTNANELYLSIRKGLQAMRG
jgi:CheY-like chemotaxis protein